MSPQDDDKGIGHGAAGDLQYSDVDSQMDDFTRSVEVNERILHSLQQYELMLLDASNLPALLDVLLLATPRLFGLERVNLWLHDPEGNLRELMDDHLDFGDSLQVVRDSFDMQQLYGVTPEVEVIDAADSRAKQVMGEHNSLQSAVMLPLVRGDEMVGTFHWVLNEIAPFSSDVERDLIRHLAAVVSICVENCANSERLSQLSLMDPLTRLSNRRGFDMELRKEISRAQRGQKSLSALFIEVDEFKDIADNYGHLSSDFILKTIAHNIDEMLRRTDHMARSDTAQFAVLLPSCDEAKTLEIAERMRSETEFMEIDDGRGANLFASLSIGVVTWNPKSYPAVNMEQLAGQIRSTATQGLQRAQQGGGNKVAVARLTTMMV